MAEMGGHSKSGNNNIHAGFYGYFIEINLLGKGTVIKPTFGPQQ